MSLIALAVEDDEMSRVLYTSLLTSLGCEVVEAADGATALDALARSSFHMVCLDLLLPNVDGSQILDYIYQASHLVHTRVVVVTAHHQFRHTLKLRPQDIFLLKPLQAREIRKAFVLALQSYLPIVDDNLS